MSNTDLYMKMLTAKQESVNFGRLAENLDKLIAYATKAKEQAEEMEHDLKRYAGQLDDLSRLDPEDKDDAEWGVELAENIARYEAEMLVPIQRNGRGRPGLATLLSLCKDYGDYSGFKSELLDKAEAEKNA